MLTYKDKDGNRTPAYMFVVWLAKTVLPIVLIICGAVTWITNVDFVLIGTFVSGALIPILNKLAADAKAAHLNPEQFYDE